MNTFKRVIAMVTVVMFIFSLGPLLSAMALRPLNEPEGKGTGELGRELGAAKGQAPSGYDTPDGLGHSITADVAPLRNETPPLGRGDDSSMYDETMEAAALAAGVDIKLADREVLTDEDFAAMRGKNRVFVIVTHQDDALLRAGITIKKMRDAGVDVCIVVLTSGASIMPDGTESGVQARDVLDLWKEDAELAAFMASRGFTEIPAREKDITLEMKYAVRELEEMRANSQLGVHDVVFLRLGSGGREDSDQYDIRRGSGKILDLLKSRTADDVRMPLFIVPDTSVDTHIAHQTTEEVVNKVIQQFVSETKRPVEVWSGMRSSTATDNTTWVPVSKEEIEHKRVAFEGSYPSQSRRQERAREEKIARGETPTETSWNRAAALIHPITDEDRGQFEQIGAKINEETVVGVERFSVCSVVPEAAAPAGVRAAKGAGEQAVRAMYAKYPMPWDNLANFLKQNPPTEHFRPISLDDLIRDFMLLLDNAAQCSIGYHAEASDPVVWIDATREYASFTFQCSGGKRLDPATVVVEFRDGDFQVVNVTSTAAPAAAIGTDDPAQFAEVVMELYRLRLPVTIVRRGGEIKPEEDGINIVFANQQAIDGSCRWKEPGRRPRDTEFRMDMDRLRRDAIYVGSVQAAHRYVDSIKAQPTLAEQAKPTTKGITIDPKLLGKDVRVFLKGGGDPISGSLTAITGSHVSLKGPDGIQKVSRQKICDVQPVSAAAAGQGDAAAPAAGIMTADEALSALMARQQNPGDVSEVAFHNPKITEPTVIGIAQLTEDQCRTYLGAFDRHMSDLAAEGRVFPQDHKPIQITADGNRLVVAFNYPPAAAQAAGKTKGTGEAAAGGFRERLSKMLGSRGKTPVVGPAVEQAPAVQKVDAAIPQFPKVRQGDRKADRKQGEQELREFLLQAEIGVRFTIEALRNAFPKGDNPAKAWTAETLVGYGFEPKGTVYVKTTKPAEFAPPAVQQYELTDQQRSAIDGAIAAASKPLPVSEAAFVTAAYSLVSDLTARLANVARGDVFAASLEKQKGVWLDGTAVVGRPLNETERQILETAFDDVGVMWPSGKQSSVRVTLFGREFAASAVRTEEFTAFVRLNCFLHFAEQDPSMITPEISAELLADVRQGRIDIDNLRQLRELLAEHESIQGRAELQDELRMALACQDTQSVVTMVNNPGERDGFFEYIARCPGNYRSTALRVLNDDSGIRPYIKQNPEGFLSVCAQFRLSDTSANRRYAQGCVEVLGEKEATYQDPQALIDYLTARVFPYADVVIIGSDEFTPDKSGFYISTSAKEAGQGGRYKINMRCTARQAVGNIEVTVAISRGEEIPVSEASYAERLNTGEIICANNHEEVCEVVRSYAEARSGRSFYCDFSAQGVDDYCFIHSPDEVNDNVGRILRAYRTVTSWYIRRQSNSYDLLIVPAEAAAIGRWLPPNIQKLLTELQRSEPDTVERFLALQQAAKKNWAGILQRQTKPLTIAVVVPTFAGDMKRVGPEGEDAFMYKLFQLQELANADENNLVTFKLYVVDDKPGPGVEEMVEGYRARAAQEGIDLGKISIECLRLADAVEAGKVAGLASSNDSRKWGSMVYGMTTAVDEGADVVVMTDPDTNQQLVELPNLVAPILAENYAAVVGSRFTRGAGSSNSNIGPHNYIELLLYNPLVNLEMPEIVNATQGHQPITDIQSGFKAFSAKYLRAALPEMRTYTFTGDSELLFLIALQDGRILEVPRSEMEELPGGSTINPHRYSEDFVGHLRGQLQLHSRKDISPEGEILVAAIAGLDVESWQNNISSLSEALYDIQAGRKTPAEAATWLREKGIHVPIAAAPVARLTEADKDRIRKSASYARKLLTMDEKFDARYEKMAEEIADGKVEGIDSKALLSSLDPDPNLPLGISPDNAMVASVMAFYSPLKDASGKLLIDPDRPASLSYKHEATAIIAMAREKLLDKPAAASAAGAWVSTALERGPAKYRNALTSLYQAITNMHMKPEAAEAIEGITVTEEAGVVFTPGTVFKTGFALLLSALNLDGVPVRMFVENEQQRQALLDLTIPAEQIVMLGPDASIAEVLQQAAEEMGVKRIKLCKLEGEEIDLGGFDFVDVVQINPQKIIILSILEQMGMRIPADHLFNTEAAYKAAESLATSL